MNSVARLGKATIDMVRGVGRAMQLLWQILGSSYVVVLRPREFFLQLYNVGVLSLLIVSVSGIFVGMVLALQGHYILSRFSAEAMLGVMVAASLVRELGPVVAALLFAGRAGSALTAEIGLMKATEQLSGLEMMAVNPVSRILTPRFFAGIVSMPILAVIFSALGIYGGHFVGVTLMGVDDGTYWSQMIATIDFYEDVMNGVIKSFVFGVICTWIALFQGYDAPQHAPWCTLHWRCWRWIFY